ncbi:uncharacterized protein LOC112411566 isoform X4 [Neophocaena asiaeorientalis asiaeorientalis]|uniref:Uncharacterized protein LOC112411566 isoform X4 n=1 Tax=Neophocaena asiaeorientalis asiaeorientalis TaxID=1706337 RepID=A0A341CUX7_NEOAA|nr:uncharacterized protein LOC112411566 isoform X4 [Neophocaena asiaeorientalis asiaeorientalis]
MHPPSHLAQPLFLTLDPRVPQTEASQLPPAPASSIPGRHPGGTGHLTADGPQDRARVWMCRSGPSQEDRPQIPKSLSQDRTSASPALPISTRPCVASLSTRDSGLFPCQAPHKQHHLSPNLAGTPIPRAPSPGLLGVALTAAQTHPLPHPHSRHLLRD